MQTHHKKSSESLPLVGTVIAAYGKRYQVELSDTKQKISCVTRGKKTIWPAVIL